MFSRRTLLTGAVLTARGAAASTSIPPELQSPRRERVPIKGIGQNQFLHRHDPSNIIRHDGRYYLWYTEHRPEVGFIDAYVMYATSEDGLYWQVKGPALARGTRGDWDEHGALTTYVVPHNDRFYLFYTGVGAEFRDPHHSKRGIGYAVSDTPGGPWKKHDAPVLWPGDSTWDDLCCDDANILFREGKWWLYYKGRTIGDKPRESRVGVATSEHLTGPWTKHAANPLLPGHAFSAWVHRNGVAFIGGEAGGHHVHWSTDGIHFKQAGPFDSKSTGFYCPDNFRDGKGGRGVAWGFDVERTAPRYIYRFKCTMMADGSG